MELYSKSSNVYRREYWESASDVSAIEEGLITPQDQQVFLSASLAFLQKKLQDKIEEKRSNKSFSCSNEKSYSNLLVFEFNNGKSSERYFVRVNNKEKYEELLKEECTVSARKKLSFDQILPKPKKPKTESKSFIKRFKPSSLKISLVRAPAVKKSTSFLTIFKRSTASLSQCNFSCASAMSLRAESFFENLRLPPTPSQNSILSGFIKPHRSDSCCSYASTQLNENPLPPCSSIESITKPMILGPEEVEILRLIPNSPSNRKRRRMRNFQQQSNLPLECGDGVVTRRCSSSCSGGSVRVCSSKLSVCIEDDEDEEEGRRSTVEVSNYGSCNLTDEVKSNFSTEGLDIIRRRLMQYFEYNTRN